MEIDFWKNTDYCPDDSFADLFYEDRDGFIQELEEMAVAQQLKKIPVIVPPMELQQQFAAFVEQTDKSKLAIQQSLDKLELLKKSLMQEYFG